MSDEITIEKIMSLMPGAFQPDKAGDASAVIQFQLSGAEAGDWMATIKDGTCKVERGTSPSPNLTLTADSQVYKDIVTGRINPMKAFMDGGLKLGGDLNLAMKFMGWFKME